MTEVEFDDFFIADNKQWFSELILAGDGAKHSLQCYDAPGGESRRNFLALCLSVAEYLAREKPEARFTPTAKMKARNWALTVAGILSIAFSYHWIAPLVPSLQSWEQAVLLSWDQAIFVWLFTSHVLGGIYLLWKFNPWKSIFSETPAEAAERIRRAMAG